MADMITQVVNSNSYLVAWNPDFLSDKLGKQGTCARYYHELKLAVDVDNPQSKVTLLKKTLLIGYGFRYLCIPPGCFLSQLQQLYQQAMQ